MSRRVALTDEERKARQREAARRYRAESGEAGRERDRQYRAANRERINEQRRKRREANRDRINEQKRRHAAANREANRERCREWRLANQDYVREKNRRYRQENEQKLREYLRNYQSINAERIRERCSQYREANRETLRERTRQWRERNPDTARSLALQSRRLRRAREAGAIDPSAPPTTAAATARRVWLFGNCCAYCGSDGPLHLDHVEPLARGGLHTPDNLVPACQRCNLSKQAKPVEAWYLSQSFFSPERWEALQAHTGKRWSAAEQLSLMDLLTG